MYYNNPGFQSNTCEIFPSHHTDDSYGKDACRRKLSTRCRRGGRVIVWETPRRLTSSRTCGRGPREAMSAERRAGPSRDGTHRAGPGAGASRWEGGFGGSQWGADGALGSTRLRIRGPAGPFRGARHVGGRLRLCDGGGGPAIMGRAHVQPERPVAGGPCRRCSPCAEAWAGAACCPSPDLSRKAGNLEGEVTVDSAEPGPGARGIQPSAWRLPAYRPPSDCTASLPAPCCSIPPPPPPPPSPAAHRDCRQGQ